MLYWALFLTGMGWCTWCGGMAAEEHDERHRPSRIATWIVLTLPGVLLSLWALVSA